MVTLNPIALAENDLLIAPDDSPNSSAFITADDSPDSSAFLTTLASNIIEGSDAPETIIGTPGDDRIFALGGDDTIIGTTGNDFIDGGEGLDTVDYSNFGEPVTILTAGSFDDGGQTQLFSIENIIGAVGEANAIDGSSVTEGPTSLNIDLSNNSLIVENIPVVGSLNIGVENFVTVFGTSNDDVVVGNTLANDFSGGDGNDTLFGEDNNDTLDGGARDDFLDGGAGADLLLGGNGKDTLNGGIGNDTLDAGASDDVLFGLDGDDILNGSSGRDTLDGGTGNDLLDGGTSDDALFGFDGDDTLIGGNGRDTLFGGVGNDLITGGNSPDTFVLSSEAGTDTIADFQLNSDVIGLSEGITFDELFFSGDEIIFGTQTLATLNQTDTTTLTADDFVVI